MKTSTALPKLLLLTGALLPAACGGKKSDALSVVITGDDTMKFSGTEFSVPAGAEVALTFRNTGSMPKQVMGHNLVVLARDADADAYAAAGLQYPDNDYVDASLQGQVFAATKLLGPGEEQVLRFTAPSEPGSHPFVCTFPGHAAAGMKGVMRVE